MQSRLVQNFSGGRALIATARHAALEGLQSTLVKLGMSVEYPSWAESDLVAGMAQLQIDRDVLFVDGDLDGVAGNVLPGAEALLPPVPVIGLVGIEAPGRLKALLHLGATAFLRKPVHGAAVYTTLFLGINQFLLRQDMQNRIADLERRRRGRRFVISAVVRLMQRRTIDDDAAYALLRRESMKQQQTIEEYCERWLDESDGTAGIAPDRTGRRSRN